MDVEMEFPDEFPKSVAEVHVIGASVWRPLMRKLACT
jgi:hypothetical protein